jgi:AraC-like DNA-binding protein
MHDVERTLADTELLLDIGITVHDVRGVFHDAEGQPSLPRARQTHQPRTVCKLGFERRWRERCLGTVYVRAAREGKPFVSHCWKHVIEVVVPIFRGDTHVATVFAGSWRDPAYPPDAPGLPGRVQRAWNALPTARSSHLRAVGHLLSAVGHGLLRMLDAPPAAPAETRRARVHTFLAEHAHEPIGLPDLARNLALSPSRASHVVKEVCGLSFRQLLQAERLRRARSLLLSTDLTVSEIAARIGYANPYHLIRAFKNLHGLPPGQYHRHTT